jgi:predicted HTH domain antitoxin
MQGGVPTKKTIITYLQKNETDKERNKEREKKKNDKEEMDDLVNYMNMGMNFGPRTRKKTQPIKTITKPIQKKTIQTKPKKEKKTDLEKAVTKLEKLNVSLKPKSKVKKEDINDKFMKELKKQPVYVRDYNEKVFEIFYKFIKETKIEEDNEELKDMIKYHNINTENIVKFLDEIREKSDSKFKFTEYFSYYLLQKIVNGDIKMKYLVCNGESFEKDYKDFLELQLKLKELIKDIDNPIAKELSKDNFFNLENLKNNISELLKDSSLSDDIKTILKKMKSLLIKKICIKLKLFVENHINSLGNLISH